MAIVIKIIVLRKFSADYIFPSSGPPIKGGMILTEDDGTVIDVISGENIDFGLSDIEKHEGIICPGFINTHCHLELSHLRSKITPGTGLHNFIQELQDKRNSSAEEVKAAMQQAEEEMIKEGIVAVGDISNTNHSFELKSKGSIAYHTFIEAFGFSPERADTIYEKARFLKEEYLQINKQYKGVQTNVSIVPHAPYSVSTALFKKISAGSYTENSLLSMHNQESPDENLLFLKGEGKLREMLEKLLPDIASWKATALNSLPSVIVHLPPCNKILLVHNTFTSKEDIKKAHHYSKMVWWCFCPKANLFIENKLPSIDTFRKAGGKITIGTDSLASNNSLSILDELKTISNYYPHITLEELINWATRNGAEFLGFKQLGSIEKGKKMGLNLIKWVDLNSLSLTNKSTVYKLI